MKSNKNGPILLFTGLAVMLFSFILVPAAPAAKVDRILSAPIPAAEYVGQETCVTCHEKESKEFEHSTHGKFAVKDEEALGQGCESCHGAGSKHVDAGGEKGAFILNPKKNPQPCFQCHLDKKAEFNLQYHHPVLEGKVSCVDCHDPHAEEVMPWTATTLEGPNETCFKCHPDKKGPFVYEHDAMREGCTICHNPHGSINKSLLTANDMNLCLKCHYQQSYPVLGTAAGMNHYSSATGTLSRAENCASCHVAVHGSNFDKRLQRY